MSQPAVGIAGVIHPVEVTSQILTRDMSIMAILTLSLFLLGYGFKGRQGRINRIEGAILLFVYCGYTIYLAIGAINSGT